MICYVMSSAEAIISFGPLCNKIVCHCYREFFTDSLVSLENLMKVPSRKVSEASSKVLLFSHENAVLCLQLASCLIYSYALIQYMNRFAVDRMVMIFFTMLLSVKFVEEKVLVFFILHEKC